jgi:glycosyltransferase involved in cell wall biosynthesis
MNVLILSKKLWPEGSGGELATFLYTKLLIENDINVKVAISSTSNHFKAWSELPIYKIPTIGYGKYTMVPMFKKLRELFEWSDVVYCTDYFHIIPIIKQVFKKPVVVHIHDYFPACPIGSLYNFEKSFTCKPDDKKCSKCIWHYERAYMRPFPQALTSTLLNSIIGRSFLNFAMLTDALIFVSNAQRSLFLKHISNLQHKSYVIYNPLPNISYIPIEGNDIGYFGGLNPLKGFLVLMNAWLKISPRHKTRIHATMFKGLSNPEQLRSMGIIPYGRLSERFYKHIYKKIKVISVPSIWQEPLPYVVIEALLRGRLLIASKVGGIPEIANGLKGALLIKPNDVDALAEALDLVLSIDKNEAIELGLKNHEEILKRFNNSKSAEELIRIFERVMNEVF